MSGPAPMTLAEEVTRRLLLAGLADDPALKHITDWNAAALARNDARETRDIQRHVLKTLRPGRPAA